MSIPFVDKHIYIILTTRGKMFDHAGISIQDLILSPDGKYTIRCLAAANNAVDSAERYGEYRIKQQKAGKIVLMCDEETGQFSGKYEVTFDVLKDDMGEMHSLSIGSGELMDGLYQVVK